MLKQLLKRIVFGRRGLQPLFSALHRLSLRGMNIGGGGTVAESGERYVIRRIAELTAGRDLVVFDVGANVGDYAIMAQAQFDGRAVIHCFEPSAATFEQLQRRGLGKARLNHFGLSDAVGEVVLFSSEERSGLSSLYDRKLDHIDLRLDSVETVFLSTLDDYCREQGLPRVDVLKLDVEGHELAVLRGATKLLEAGGIDFIQFEFGGCNIDSRTYFQDFYYLLVPRFRLYRILANGLWPIERYDESLEAFGTTNYLAVRRDSGFYL